MLNMTKKIKWEFVYTSNQPTLFKEILLEKMHNTDGTAPSRSRMENIATGERIIQNGLTALTARDGNGDLIVVAFCETPTPDEQSTPGIKLKNSLRENSRVEEVYPWHMMFLGTFSVFVRPSCRGLGLATEAILKMEERRINACALLMDRKVEKCVPFFQAFGKSAELIKKHSKQSETTERTIGQKLFNVFNHGVGMRVRGMGLSGSVDINLLDLSEKRLQILNESISKNVKSLSAETKNKNIVAKK